MSDCFDGSALQANKDASATVAVLVRDVKAFCETAVTGLVALRDMLDATGNRIPVTTTGFYADAERRLAHDIACRLLSESETLLPRFQSLAADLLAFDRRLLIVNALIDRCVEGNSQAEQTLAQMARICKSLQAGMTRLCFTDLPNFYICIEKNVDFDGDGARCAPQEIRRACADMRRATSNMVDNILNVGFL